MDRRVFIGVVGGSILAGPLAADGQQSAQVQRVGTLSSGSPVLDEVPAGGWQIFLQRLSDLGWTAGRNLTFEPRYAEGRLERLPDLAADLVQLKVGMIVTFGTQASLAAKRATTTIPIVFIASDPVGAGLVASLAHPQGNSTGLSNEAGLEIFAKRLELLKEVAPRISRVGIIANLSNVPEARALDSIAPNAQTLRLSIFAVEARSPTEFDSAFARLTRERVDALSVTESPLHVEHKISIVGFATRNRLPAIFGERVFVGAGGLMSYGISFADLLRRLPVYMDKILRGAKPADLPVEQPTKFELVINLKTARALGLTIPQTLLLRADQVIE